jgi:hypothetical protein
VQLPGSFLGVGVYGSGGAPRGRHSTYLFRLRQPTLVPEGAAQALVARGIKLAAIFKRSDFPEIL